MGLTQDRTPYIHQVISNYHNLFNVLEAGWKGMAGMPQGHEKWDGLFIPDLSTGDPRSHPDHSEYMDWVKTQNYDKFAKELGWQGDGLSIDFLRGEYGTIPTYDIPSGTETGLHVTEVLHKQIPDGNKLVGDKFQPVENGVDFRGITNLWDKFIAWIKSIF